MDFRALPPFEKELKRFQKKFRSLQKDVERFKAVLSTFPNGNGGKHWNKIYGDESLSIFKVRLACASLPKGADFRIVYAHCLGLNRIDLIELYWKGDKSNEDRSLMKQYLQLTGSNLK
jgi:hypothetical protein